MPLGLLQYWVIAILRSIFGLTPGTGGSGGSYTLTGPILIGDGTSAAPSYSWSSETNSGWFRFASGDLRFVVGGATQCRIISSGLQMLNGQPLLFSNLTTLLDDAADTLAQRRGVNAQTFRVYNTYTDASNYERAELSWSGNVCSLITANAGSGSARTMSIVPANNLFLGGSGAQLWLIQNGLFGGVAGQAFQLGGLTNGAVTTARLTVLKKTGIADNSATAVITVTVPNANHACAIKLTFLSSNGSTAAFQSSRCAEGCVIVARTTGANAVVAVATLTLTQIATVAAGATHTLAYGVSAISGAVGATNTFDVTVTIDDSSNVGSNQVVVLAELINAEATGVTMIAA